MIKINLLPTEKRKAERTPLPRFLLIASTAAAFFILLFYNIFILTQISRTRDDIATEPATLRGLEPFVLAHGQRPLGRDPPEPPGLDRRFPHPRLKIGSGQPEGHRSRLQGRRRVRR